MTVRSEGGALVDGGAVHVNADGTFLVKAGPRWAELFLADESGAIVRQIGRSGEGPGEWFRPLSVAELPDAFVVFDPFLSRVTWLAKGDLAVARTARMPPANTGTLPAVFADGSYVLSGPVPTREAAGRPLHVVTPDGEVLRSFGEDPSPSVIAPSGDSAVWAAQGDRYRLEKWHLDGRLVAVYEREADWFPALAADAAPEAGDASLQISGMWEDGLGRLWVHMMVRTLTEVIVLDDDGHEMRTLRHDPDPKSSQEVIEVLDPRTASVVARRRIPESDGLVAMGGFFQQVHRSTDRGLLEIDIWATRLVTGEASPPGLEPGTYCLGGSRSIHLSYGDEIAGGQRSRSAARRPGDSQR